MLKRFKFLNQFSNSYNIIVVPEKGGSSKNYNLPVKLIKFLFIIFISIFIFLLCFFVKYRLLTKETASLIDSQKYMNSLESDNENKDEIIKNYQDNEDEIKTRLSELDKLEDAVKSKIENSISLNNIDVNNLSYSKQTLSSSSKDLIISLDTKIDEYTDLSKELDNLLEKEKYIPSFVPCQGEISSYFGDRENPFDLSSTEYHKGLDIANYYGTKIYASAKGTVTLATYYGGYGNAIIINHHNGYETIYGHTSKIYVSEGDEVEKGDLIALVGSTGSSTGPHLHFELRKNGVPINPLNFIQGGF